VVDLVVVDVVVEDGLVLATTTLVVALDDEGDGVDVDVVGVTALSHE
jgi:hypothetical protein